MVNLELEFESKKCPCLRRNLRDVQQQEQTLELRLPEGMPDIGSVLGAWGQCILRGKEWRSDEIGVSGGVMVWVLYLPAEGGEPQSVEAWLSLQPKWSLSGTRREGTIRTCWRLNSADARMLSARKMMVRVNVGVMAEVMEPREAELFTPGQVPEDVQLLRREYPVRIPKEAGEKTFQLEQSFAMPQGSPPPEQILYCRFIPQLTDTKLVGGRMVFKGVGQCHLLYRAESGGLHTVDFELPFSQLEDLAQTPDQDAQPDILLALTNLEPELQEGQLNLKVGLAAQYVVYDRILLDLIEDAYSTMRELTVNSEPLELEAVLESSIQQLQPEVHISGQRLLDAAVYTGQPKLRHSGDQLRLELSGRMQALVSDEEGRLETVNVPWQDQWELPADGKIDAYAQVLGQSAPQTSVTPGQFRVSSALEVQTCSIVTMDNSMVTGLTLGQSNTPDPGRPSLVLKRLENATLWDLAKASGSTVAAICRANKITQEPVDNRLLLIPIE